MPTVVPEILVDGRTPVCSIIGADVWGVVSRTIACCVCDPMFGRMFENLAEIRVSIKNHGFGS